MEKLKMLTIQEVGERLGLTTHTLRFWEKELDGFIVPLRTKGGQRRYTLEHLFVIDEIKRLKTKGLSLANIKKELDDRYNNTADTQEPEKVDLLANRIAEILSHRRKLSYENTVYRIQEPELGNGSQPVLFLRSEIYYSFHSWYSVFCLLFSVF
jgi:DNA-binding transcriptional MerR regulator